MTASDETTIYIVRHAIARGRSSWDEPDVMRPLTTHGRAQAEALGERFAIDGAAIAAVHSSPAQRCVETVTPASRRLELPIVEDRRLLEGSDPDESLARLIEVAQRLTAGRALIACTHGDVIEGVLAAVVELKIEIDGPLIAPKGSTWRLLVVAGAPSRARYIAPPP